MTELEMMQFFSKFGEVLDAKIITDRDGGKSKGYIVLDINEQAAMLAFCFRYGFVTFATEEQAASVYSKVSVCITAKLHGH